MKKRIHFLLIPILLLAYGCSKKNTALAKVQTVTEPVSNETFTYIYNTDGRVRTIQGSKGDYTSYLYLGSYITATQYDKNGNITGTTTYFLNSKLLADSIADISSFTFYYKNTYDGNGFLVSQKQYDKNNILFNTEYYTVTNGNILEERGTGDSTTNTFNNHANSIGNSNTGQPFLGKDSKNLLNTSNSTVEGLINYSYTHDGEGRVTSVTANYVSYSSSSTTAYTYY